LYGSSELNPAILFPGNANASGQCFAQGYTLTTAPNAVCSTTANTNNRRITTLINPVEGLKYANIGNWDDGGTRSYNALLLNTQTQYANQISPDVDGNKCTDDLTKASGFNCLWLNSKAFGIPALGGLGNLGLGTAYDPGSLTINAGLSRIFKLKETQTVEFRA